MLRYTVQYALTPPVSLSGAATTTAVGGIKIYHMHIVMRSVCRDAKVDTNTA